HWPAEPNRLSKEDFKIKKSSSSDLVCSCRSQLPYTLGSNKRANLSQSSWANIPSSKTPADCTTPFSGGNSLRIVCMRELTSSSRLVSAATRRTAALLVSAPLDNSFSSSELPLP